MGTAHDQSPRGVPGRPRESYLPQLDGLRALAITLVMIHHFVSPLLFGGWIGVDVFFVLSGYLITGILLREIGHFGRIRLRRFYVRRLLRLYPPLLLAVILLTAAGLTVTRQLIPYLVNAGLAVTYLMPFATSLNLAGGGMWRHTWSLGIEEFFYLIWPALLLTLRKRAIGRGAPALAIGLGVLLLIGLGVSDVVTDHSVYLLRAAGLFFGCALALALERSQRGFGPIWGVGGLIAIAAAAALGSFQSTEIVPVPLAIAGTLALLMHFTTRESPLVSMFASRPAAYIGRISYELYIWHYAVLTLFSRWLTADFLEVAWIAVPLSIGLAAASHALLVRPMDRWKARIPY